VYKYAVSENRTSCFDDVVLLSYSELQSFEVVILVDMDILVEYILVLADEVEAFDGHGEMVMDSGSAVQTFSDRCEMDDEGLLNLNISHEV
jgi:hypothetical protein